MGIPKIVKHKLDEMSKEYGISQTVIVCAAINTMYESFLKGGQLFIGRREDRETSKGQGAILAGFTKDRKK